MKSKLADLAVFGGPRSFEQPLHVGRPNIGDRAALLSRVEDILDRRWLTNDGVYVGEFERRVAELLEVGHCVATTNGTAALQLLVRARGLRGEVIVPSLTFVATAHALEWEGVSPVFCDVGAVTWTIDPEHVAELIGPETSAVVGVHTWGRACDVERLDEVAKHRGLGLLFDAAHALGCSYRGIPIGGFGEGEVFSFHATKVCNSAEGGMVATNDQALAQELRSLRNFGFSGTDRVDSLGINAKMSELSAAMGLTSLAELPRFIEHNRQTFGHYRSELSGLPGIELMEPPAGERWNHHYVVLQVHEEPAGLSRDQLLAVLQAEGVLARRYFHPGCHRAEPYVSRSGPPTDLPVTESLLDRVLCLPTGTAIDQQAAGRVCAAIRVAVSEGAEARRRLQEGRP